ncbi:hypothetical protein SAMN05216388_1008149 [Halorientalis persicus]|uniref:ABC-2 type transport system permease protein n=1 Tax=Halorientalis persicus TaxID=1367881 RepID=A0A1H8M7X9_9EURY|nr:hypothetical protein [Halorientalis persicus]SEO13435.1 hypothetical protein SAMN05216388_1008149 [Halorientalis persicus]
MSLTTDLFRRMLREEWRLHEHLFGGRRFAAFPVAVALLSAGGFALLSYTGTDFGAIVAGLHGLLFFFGLQVGTIGLVGRDALRDALGDVTLLVFSARTLPVSWNRLLAVFLWKDLLYYTGFFIAPIGIAAVPTALESGLAPGRIALLWLTLIGAFALGVTLSLTLAGAATRSRWLVVVPVALVVAAVVWPGFDALAYTPYAPYRDPSILAGVRGFAPVAVFGVLGPVLFRPADSGAYRTASERFTTLGSWLRDDDGLTTRAILEVSRSSGSVWKVLFSMGVLFAVTALLLGQITAATGLQPSPGVAFGTLLGLGSFTTYSWVTQFDSADEYLRYPVSVATVLAAKRRAYLLLSVPAGLVYLAIAAVWYDPVALASGLAVLPLLSVYVFGVTAFVAGLSPTELLFDTPRFLAFGAALSVVAMPLLVAALVEPAFGPGTTVAAVALAAVAAVVGLLLQRRAGPRWERRLRG